MVEHQDPEGVLSNMDAITVAPALRGVRQVAIVRATGGCYLRVGRRLLSPHCRMIVLDLARHPVSPL